MKDNETRTSEDYLRGLIRDISLDLTEPDLALVVSYSLNLKGNANRAGEGIPQGRGSRACG